MARRAARSKKRKRSGGLPMADGRQLKYEDWFMSQPWVVNEGETEDAFGRLLQDLRQGGEKAHEAAAAASPAPGRAPDEGGGESRGASGLSSSAAAPEDERPPRKKKRRKKDGVGDDGEVDGSASSAAAREDGSTGRQSGEAEAD
ncbi:unnamed protein product [Vitrella brassicaformis CCMP3155]|uniref:Uncharacterized protein n=1 Tax=Vitrella brassicaformis (strain CCMP3155) TaxID=1169540 RepID=A0A0G4EAF1_VITBC|nr:unnamed protein product [Vitrella brassicaformis CCMP3155]|eukprot:CEL92580.1 unnamed protein product [Vitrella brassicaformis CCMP3155]